MHGTSGERRLAVVLAVIVVAVGCSRPSVTPGVSVDPKLTPEPARIGKETIALAIKDSSGEPISGAHITLEGNMAHPGMAPIFAECRELGSGRYEGALELDMRGSWVILLHVRLASGEKVERQVALEVKAD